MQINLTSMTLNNAIVTFTSNDDNSLEISCEQFLKTEIGTAWNDNKDTFKRSKFKQQVPFSFTSLFCVINELIPTHFENSDFFQCYYYFYPSKLNEMNVIISVMKYSRQEGLLWTDVDEDLDNFDFFDVSWSIFDTKVTKKMSLTETLNFFHDFSGNDEQAFDWFKFVLILQNDGKMIPNLLGNDTLNDFITRIITNFKPEALAKIYLSPWVIFFSFLNDCNDEVVTKFLKCCLLVDDVDRNYEIMSSQKLQFYLDNLNLLKAAILIEPKVVRFVNLVHHEEIQPLQLVECLGEHFGLFLQFLDSQFPTKFISTFLQHPKILDLSEEQKYLTCKNMCENILKKSALTCHDIKDSLLRYDFMKFLCREMIENPSNPQMKTFVQMLAELI